MHLPNKCADVTSAHLLNRTRSCIIKPKKGGNRMIKKMAVTVTLVLICILVFGCRGNKSSEQDTGKYYESEKVSFNDGYTQNQGEQYAVPSDIEIEEPNDYSYKLFITGMEFISDGNIIVSRLPSSAWQENPDSDLLTRSNIQLSENNTAVSVVLYELADGEWERVDSVTFSTPDRGSICLVNTSGYETAYFDLAAGTVITVPLTFENNTVELAVPLKKAGVRTLTYLFAGDFDSEQNVMLGGYVVVSEQRRLLEEFDGSYFDDPSTLPVLDENCEIFAITIELGK